MDEMKVGKIKTHLQNVLTATEVTHAFLSDYNTHLFIIVTPKTTHYLYVKNGNINTIIDWINRYAIQILKPATEEKRYYLAEYGIDILTSDFDTFIRSKGWQPA